MYRLVPPIPTWHLDSFFRAAVQVTSDDTFFQCDSSHSEQSFYSKPHLCVKGIINRSLEETKQKPFTESPSVGNTGRSNTKSLVCFHQLLDRSQSRVDSKFDYKACPKSVFFIAPSPPPQGCSIPTPYRSPLLISHTFTLILEDPRAERRGRAALPLLPAPSPPPSFFAQVSAPPTICPWVSEYAFLSNPRPLLSHRVDDVFTPL